MAGRPRKPTETKKMEGTFREDRANLQEPKAVKGDAVPPSYLNASEKRLFKEIYTNLQSLGIASVTDSFQIEVLASTIHRYREHAKFIRKNGDTYETKTKEGSIMRRSAPERTMMHEELRQINTMLQNLGLSPASRSRVNASIEADDEDIDGILNGPARRR